MLIQSETHVLMRILKKELFDIAYNKRKHSAAVQLSGLSASDSPVTCDRVYEWVVIDWLNFIHVCRQYHCRRTVSSQLRALLPPRHPPHCSVELKANRLQILFVDACRVCSSQFSVISSWLCGLTVTLSSSSWKWAADLRLHKMGLVLSGEDHNIVTRCV